MQTKNLNLTYTHIYALTYIYFVLFCFEQNLAQPYTFDFECIKQPSKLKLELGIREEYKNKYVFFICQKLSLNRYRSSHVSKFILESHDMTKFILNFAYHRFAITTCNLHVV